MKSQFVLSCCLSFFVMLSIQAQQNPCFTDELVDRLMQNDSQYAQEINQLRNSGLTNNSGSSRAVRTISVKVHVVYNTSAENISQTAIQNMINVLNEDFRAQNSDISSVRSQFSGDISDAQIEFCLDDIIRVQHNYSCFDPNTEANDMKTVSPSVAPTQFMNIWVVDICGTQFGGVAGYAYLPTFGMHGSFIDGIVLDYDIGFGTRSATHEVGHYFGLEHTFEGCGSHANSCTDIPQSDGANSSCNPNATSCGSTDQWENFMDYTFCRYMFTACQAGVMNNVLSNQRVSLLSSSGCSSSATGPTAEFSASPASGCPGLSVLFTDESSGSPTSWAWSFPGGTPSTSNNQNPTVTYANSGTYTVTLTATNSNGNDVETKTNYITVLNANSLPLVEGFESSFVPAGWSSLNPDNNVEWIKTTLASGYGQSSACAAFNNYDDDNRGSEDYLVSPIYDFSTVSLARLKFDYAYARYDKDFYDSLVVAYSIDCGNTYTAIWKKGGTTLATAPDETNFFIPAANEWGSDSIDLPMLAGQPSVQFAFINVSGYGNVVFLDNINIATITSNPAPVANFTGTPLTLPVGGTVNFTDMSTNPSGWAWSFPGAVQNSSNQKNPNGIQYNNPGKYDVSLTATNSFGSDSETKSDYINVIDTATSTSGCDSLTITNVGIDDTITVYSSGAPNTWGFVSGHNSYGDVAKAEVFSGVAAGSKVRGAFLFFAVASFASSSSSITVKVWDANGTDGNGNAGAPGTVLASENVLISDIAADVINDDFTFVSFSSLPSISGDFFVGIEFNYNAGDTIALWTTRQGTSIPPTGWEQWNDLEWYDYSEFWGLNASNVIIPMLCSPLSVQAPSAAFSALPTTLCEGAVVTFTDQSTNNPATWNWSFPGGTPATSTLQNPTVTYNSSGIYNVQLQVTNSNGLDTDLNSNFITVNDAPTAGLNTSNISCNGGNNGSLSLSVSGGKSPYTYSWSNGASTQNLSNLQAGTYTVVISDANGCTTSSGRSINEPAPLSASFSATEADCGVANGSASVTVSGGTLPYAYSWSNGQGGATAFGLATGVYDVTITDANSCSLTQSVTISSSGGLTVSVTTMPSSGINDGSAVASVSGGISPYSYQWSTGVSASSVAALAPGNYSLTVTDNNGCSEVETFTITSVIGIAHAEEEAKLKIYPNPNSGYFIVVLSFNQATDYDLEIYNLMGVMVKQYLGSGETIHVQIPIDIQDFSAGTYLIKLKTPEFNYIQKVVKTH